MQYSTTVSPWLYPMAAFHGYAEVVQELVRAGAALDLRDKDQRTALMKAALNGRTETVQELVRVQLAMGRDWRKTTHHRTNAYLRGVRKHAALIQTCGQSERDSTGSSWTVARSVLCADTPGITALTPIWR